MSEALKYSGDSEGWVKSIADRIVAGAEESMDTKIRPVAWTREDAAIDAFVDEAATSMPAPSRAVRIQATVDAEVAQREKTGRQARATAAWAELSDEALDRIARKAAAEQSRRNPGPEVDTGFESVADDEWYDAEPVFEYDKPSIEEGYDPVAGFRYPDGTGDVSESDDEGDDDEDLT